MSATETIQRFFTRYPGAAALIFLAFIGACWAMAIVTVVDLTERYRTLDDSSDTLARLQTLRPRSSERGMIDGSMPQGSPVLEGQSVTMASAALLQRVTSAVIRAGGTIVSSEVVPQTTPSSTSKDSKDSNVGVVIACELKQENLPQLLYDLEAGMPLLLINRFDAQAPRADDQRALMRISLGVSGLWEGAK